MTSLDPTGTELHVTDHHHFPLPPFIPGRFTPAFDGYGRYKLPNPDGGAPKAWTRATTICKTLEDTYNLERWSKRQLMRGFGENPALAEDARRAFASEKPNKDLDAIAERAQVAAGSAEAAEFGTAVHAWLEYVDHGLILPAQVPEMYQPWVRAYLTRLAAHAVTPLPEYTERIVLHRGAGAAGTLDRIVMAADGSLIMGDVKTSKSLDYSWLSYAIQLTIYRDADLMLSTDGTRWEPMPEMNADFAALIHVPSNNPEGTSLVTYDLQFGRLALDTAVLVRELRSKAPKRVPHLHALPIPDSTTARLHAAAAEMRLSSNPAHLAGIWEKNQDIWTDALTQLGMSIAEVLHAEESN